MEPEPNTLLTGAACPKARVGVEAAPKLGVGAASKAAGNNDMNSANLFIKLQLRSLTMDFE